MEYFYLVLSVLIVYRLALMIATEEGPFGIFSWYRYFIAESKGIEHWITKGFFCPLCVGFWLSFLSTPYYADGVAEWLIYSVAVAGAQTFLTLIGGIPE